MPALLATRAGAAVRGLRYREGRAGKLSRKLVARWKKICENYKKTQEASMSLTGTNEEVHIEELLQEDDSTPPGSVRDVNDKDEDMLTNLIRTMKLPLVRRQPTISDGNCWYDAIVDQMQLHGIGCVSDHITLRKEVILSLPGFEQASDWIENIFDNKIDDWERFLAEHSKPGIGCR